MSEDEEQLIVALRERNFEQAGLVLMQMFDWDATTILDVLQAALEDGNFHTINRQIDRIRQKQGV